jgi:hypothetical protein
MFGNYNNRGVFCERERELGAPRYNTIVKQHDNIYNEMRSLKSQMYELCQQSTADRGLCNRIKSSLDNSVYPGVRNYDSTKAITTTTTYPTSTNRINNHNNDSAAAAVVVVDPAKY